MARITIALLVLYFVGVCYLFFWDVGCFTWLAIWGATSPYPGNHRLALFGVKLCAPVALIYGMAFAVDRLRRE